MQAEVKLIDHERRKATIESNLEETRKIVAAGEVDRRGKGKLQQAIMNVLRVASNKENRVREALERKVKIEQLEDRFSAYPKRQLRSHPATRGELYQGRFPEAPYRRRLKLP